MVNNKRKYSSEIVDGVEQAPSRAMLRAVGFKEEDFQKPQIGIASTWSMVTPCNMHINRLAEAAAAGVDKTGCKSVIFNTITVSDGISMGTKGMRYSLVSREVIADSIETVVAGQGFDGLVAIGGCDKNMPGCLMAIARLNRPSIFVYGGSIQPGKNRTDVISVFEAVGAHSEGKISDIELLEIESNAIPGPGACGGMYTANTMASAIEALGLSLPNSSAKEAVSSSKMEDATEAGRALSCMIEKGITPREILTKEAFENAIINLSKRSVREDLRGAALKYDSLQIEAFGVVFNTSAIKKIVSAYAFNSKGVGAVGGGGAVNPLGSILDAGVVCVYGGGGLGVRWFANKMKHISSSRYPDFSTVENVTSVFRTIVLQDIAKQRALSLGIDSAYSYSVRKESLVSSLLYEEYLQFIVKGVSSPDSIDVVKYYDNYKNL